LLTFGTTQYTDADWNQIFSVLPVKPLYFTESNLQAATAAIGGFDWPMPGGGTQAGFAQQTGFLARASSWPIYIAAAFPRFDDIYAQAGVGRSWGHIDDQNGQTYVETLTNALQSGAPIVQLVTWNDWGEGTQIEPSVEYGTRDLAATQRLRRKFLTPSFPYTADDLSIPIEWYRLRKSEQGNPAALAKLDPVFSLVVSGRLDRARAILHRVAAVAPTGQ
jgi:hypothetical protein